MQARKKIAAASGRPHSDVFEWISKITLPEVTLNMLKDSEGLEVLDILIADPVQAIAFGIFQQEIELAEDQTKEEC